MVNIAILIGRLTADPELRSTPNNVPVVTFTLAVNRSYAKAGTERQADFIDIVAWRQTAEFVAKYFRKGSQIAVEGSIQTRSYEDKNGNKRKAVEVVASQIHFAESKNASAASQSAAPSPFGESPASAPAPAYSAGSAEDFEAIPDDDDLPF
mgnify:CR=1 FL=1